MISIDVTIDEEGNVELEIHGVPGKKCLNVLKTFADAIGEAGEPKRHFEYYQPAEAQKLKVGH